jgi:hypothetical protein
MNRPALFLRTIIATTAILSLSPAAVFAQGIPTTIGGLELTASSDNPVPGQSVTITATSYSVDINATNLVWTAGGKTIAKGIGVTGVVVQAPVLGKRLTVNVSATASDGTVFNDSIVIGSGSVDLIVEPDGYTPPFFRGKLPVVYQNAVKITAMPHLANSSGVEYDPKTLVYKWQQNDSVLQDQSGYGRQSVTIQGDIIPRPYALTVTVTTRDGNTQGMGLVSVSFGSPSLVFYHNDPLYGPLFNNAIGNSVYLGTEREAGVLAVPYGFNLPASGLGDLSLAWFINGKEHSELASGDSVTLRAPDNSAGSSNIELDVNNKTDILQQASAVFSAVFGAAASTTPQSSLTF